MIDIRLSDCSEDVLSFGVGEHNLLVSYPYACSTVELNLEIIAGRGFSLLTRLAMRRYRVFYWRLVSTRF